MNVQRLSAWIVSFAMLLWMSEAFAQKYPDRPIRIVQSPSRLEEGLIPWRVRLPKNYTLHLGTRNY